MKLSEFQRALGRTLCPIFGVGLNLNPFTGGAVLFAVLISGATVMEAQKPVGANDPATVPSEYVVTPFGYFHPTCLKRLSPGDVLQKDQGTIRHADGSFDPLEACNYPHYDQRGVAVPDGNGGAALSAHEKAASPSIGHSWIEAYADNTSTWYDGLGAEWSVPPAPNSNDNQTLFFFPGMIDPDDELSIIQPVLGWNSDFPDAWGIASWNCCISGTTFESTPVSVSPGDTISGSMSSACFNKSIACGSYNIDTLDVTTNRNTALSFSSSKGQVYSEAFAGALEVYSVTQCSDYPPNGGTPFFDLQLYDNNNNLIRSPSWSFINYFSGLTPQCGYRGSVISPQEVELFAVY